MDCRFGTYKKFPDLPSSTLNPCVSAQEVVCGDGRVWNVLLQKCTAISSAVETNIVMEGEKPKREKGKGLFGAIGGVLASALGQLEDDPDRLLDLILGAQQPDYVPPQAVPTQATSSGLELETKLLIGFLITALLAGLFFIIRAIRRKRKGRK